MNSPLAWIAVFFGTGIAAGSAFKVTPVLSFFAALSFILTPIFAIKRKVFSTASIYLAFFFIGCLLIQLKESPPPSHIANFTPAQPESVCVEGVILDEPRVSLTSYGDTKASFVLRAEFLRIGDARRKVTGKLRTVVSGRVEPLGCKDRISARGLLSVPAKPSNPGQFDYAEYLKNSRIYSLLRANGPDVIVLNKGRPNYILRAVRAARRGIEGMIYSHFDSETANFLDAVLLGQRQDVGYELNDVFMKTGTVHLLAISGLNVGLIAFLAMLVFRIIRMPRSANIAATALFLAFYCLLTGGRPSVMRATLMAQVVLLGSLIGREAPIENSLGFAAVVILGFEPCALFDAGFHLSFASVASILYLTPRLEQAFNYDRRLSIPFMARWKRFVIEGAFVSAAAWVGVMPLVLYHFNVVTPVAIIANLFAVPLSFLVTAASVPFIIFGFALPFIGKVFAAATWLFCEALFDIAGLLSKVPLAYLYFPKPSAYFIVVYYFLLIAFFEHKRLKISPGKASIAALLIVNALIWPSALKPGGEELCITVLDVGHGDAVVMEFPNGANILVDAGKGADFDAGRSVVLPFLRSRGIRALEAVILTHPDSDHSGGLVSVIESADVRQIFESGAEAGTKSYLDFKEAVRNKGIKRHNITCADAIAVSEDLDLICLNPPAEWLKKPALKDNDASLAFKVRYKDAALLFCSDIEEEVIGGILGYGEALKADFLMLPHHGEKLTLATMGLIEKVAPRYAAISQGRLEKEVSRSKEAEGFLSSKGVKVFRTNRDGAVFIKTDGTRVRVSSFRGEQGGAEE